MSALPGWLGPVGRAPFWCVASIAGAGSHITSANLLASYTSAAIVTPTAGFACALEMQLEALQDRLHFSQVQRIASAGGHRQGEGHREAPPPAVAAAEAQQQQLQQELAAATAQNRTLRATAARLSKALAAVMQRSQAAGGGGPQGGRKGAGRAGGVEAAAAGEVLAQLVAVEGILAEIL